MERLIVCLWLSCLDGGEPETLTLKGHNTLRGHRFKPKSGAFSPDGSR